MGRRKNLYLLVLFLAAAHLLYAPAWQAGWTRDVTGWLQSLHTKTFGDYLLRRGLRVESLYPFTQWMLWVWWKLFGVHPLPWHLLMVSLHAVCAWGWALFYGKVLKRKISGNFAGLFLLLSPYATEVVVWEAGYHYLQGMALLLGTLFALLRYLDSGKKRWLAVGLIVFLPSLFALEVFYLTPVYAALLVFYLRKNPRAPYALRAFIGPMFALCLVQYVVYRSLYNNPVPHIQTLHLKQMGDYLRKPAKYSYHITLFGRYWPEETRKTIYDVLNSWAFLLTAYPALLTLLVLKRRQLKSFSQHPVFIPITFGLVALVLVVPMYFHEEGLVYFDRYAYFMLPAVGAAIGVYFRKKWLRTSLLLLSPTLLFYTNLLWQKSDALSRQMLLRIPSFNDGKPTLLLNIPNALKSVPMIGQTREGEAALMRQYVLEKPFPATVLEPSACNLLGEDDIAVEIRWINSQSLMVTQPRGGGWWTGGVLSTDWENNLFALRFFPEKRTYVLILKVPAAELHLLLWDSSKWIQVRPEGPKAFQAELYCPNARHLCRN